MKHTLGADNAVQSRRAGRVAGAIILCLAALFWAFLAALPVSAQSGVVVIKTVETGNDDRAVAFNGDTITYTISVNNETGVTITDLLLLDVLPENVLDTVRCVDSPTHTPCQLIFVEREVPEPLGGTILITTTSQLSWEIPSLGPNVPLRRTFTARVIGQGDIGQEDESAFVNVAYLRYFDGSQTRTVQSNDLSLSVALRIERTDIPLSDSPTWFSEDVGGTLSMDWADFDGDGFLDLVLGSTVGTTVYRNNNGRLEQFWNTASPAYGVRWADVTGNGRPELIAVGAVTGNTAQTNPAQLPGINYVYRFDPTTRATDRRFVELSNFTSAVQMVRVEPGDFNNDGFVDLVTSSNAINPECAVKLYLNDGAGVFTEAPECISRAATAALKPVDFDNDGDLDLVLGVFPNRVVLLVNENGQFEAGNAIVIEDGVMFLPYDFAWGDFDRDGYLDLAAAYPLMREARIYRNQAGAGFDRPLSVRTSIFLTPYALDWGDFTSDGCLDLAVANSPPTVYSYPRCRNATAPNNFSEIFALDDAVVQGQVWSLRAVDYNNDGDIDLALTDRDGPSLVIANLRPPINTNLTPVPGVPSSPNSTPSRGVTWADMDGDGYLDLVYSAGPSTAGPAALNTKIYYNSGGEFPPGAVRIYSGFDHTVAVGDMDGNGALDVAVATLSETRLHASGDFLAPRRVLPATGEKFLAWGDMDGNGKLDLLVVLSDPLRGTMTLYMNDGAGNLSATPSWRIDLSGVQAVAWGDMDDDGHLDLAVAVNGRNRICRNQRDNSFDCDYWIADVQDNSRAVAWADFDGDRDLDVVFGNFGVLGGAGEINRLYQNIPDPFNPQRRTFTPVTGAFPNDAYHTTSLDWGDVDNDGRPDLAVGNFGEPDQIYINRSRVNVPRFYWLWTSNESLRTTGIAWGDMDNDGDLDLAISQDGATRNGVYVNNLIVPSHLPGEQFGVATLINPPMYIHAGRPGITSDAFLFSAGEVLAGPGTGPVEISYRIYNPGATTLYMSSTLTETLLQVQHEYSLDGGGTWRTATSLGGTLTPVTDSLGLGLTGSFLWDATRDQAISDNARFRVRLIEADRSGPVQRVTSSVITPPFRVRALTCVWPEAPDVQLRPFAAQGGEGDAFDYVVDAGQPIELIGKVAAGTGTHFYVWDFGDGQTARGQVTNHTFQNGTYTVRMAVYGEPCPRTRERVVTLTVRVGTGQSNVHFPLISMNSGGPSTPSDSVAAAEVATVAPPPQIDGLRGVVQVDTGARWLRWHAPATTPDAIRLYRGEGDDLAAMAQLAELPPDTTAYVDDDPVCGQTYYVTTVSGGQESLPSTATYVAPACAQEGR